MIEQAEALHRRACVADAHADSLMWNRDLTFRSGEGQVDFPRLREAGVDLQAFTVVTRGFPILGGFPLFAAWRRWPVQARGGEWTRALWQLERMTDFCRRSEGAAALTTTASQLRGNLEEGRLSVVLGVEGGHALEGRVERVRELHARGVRFMSPLHLSNNALGGSSFPLMLPRGLTPHGHQVVEEMAATRMAVDVAHASTRTLSELLAHPRARVFSSHTGVRGAGGGWRNLSDEALRAIADRGGVVGILFATVYLGGKEVSDVVRHLEHAISVMGEDGVGYGSDFDGMVALPRGMRDVTGLALITAELLRRGHPEARVEKIIGGNWRRFFGELLG